MTDRIQLIREAALRVAQTTEKGSLAASVHSYLPKRRKLVKREEEVRYGPGRMNIYYLSKSGRSGGRIGNPAGWGYYPTLNSMEAIGIISHTDSQHSAPKYED